MTAPQKDTASEKFYFSSLAARFFYLGVKVFKQDVGLIGFFLLKVRNHHLSLIFSYFNDDQADAMAAALIHQASAIIVERVTIYDPRLVDSVKELEGSEWSGKKVSRGFMLTKPFAAKNWVDCRLQGGDGDLAFY